MKESDIKKKLKNAISESISGSLIFSINDKYIFGIPDLFCFLPNGNDWIFEIKVVRKKKISLQPLQVETIMRLQDVGREAYFVLYFESIKKYALFTWNEIERKCYKDIPPDIQLMKLNDFISWLSGLVDKKQLHKYR